VAREYRVTETALAAATNLRSSDSLQGAEAVVVPVPPAPAPPARTLLYTVRKGETLVTISDRFGVSLNQLRRWNRITGIKVQPGQKLHVADPASLPRAQRAPQQTPLVRARERTAARRPRRKSPSTAPEALPARRRKGDQAQPNPAQRSAPRTPRPLLRNKIGPYLITCLSFAGLCIHAIATMACVCGGLSSAT
jgi:membrane-bound lytic murein transglycosylase D